MRVVKAVRLSKLTDETTSPERQSVDVDQEVSRQGGTVVGEAVDLSVSAITLSPFQRPALKAWLSDNPPEAFDAIAWARLDRAVRSMRDLHALAGWALQHRKKLIFAKGPHGSPLTLDFSNGPLDPVSELMMTLLAFAAQMEGAAIQERNKGTAAHLLNIGRWRGGPIAYGYRPVDNPDGEGKILVPDPVSSEIVREIVRRIIDGETPEAICRDLDARGVPTPANYHRTLLGKEPVEEKNGKPVCWNPTSVRNDLLRSRALLGQTERYVRDDKGKKLRDERGKLKRQVVRGSDGMPIIRAEPLISTDDFNRLQAALESRGIKKVIERRDANPLLNIAKCVVCGSNLYFRQFTKKGKEYSYYYCPNKCTSSIPGEVLDDWFSKMLLSSFGDLEIFERKFIPAEDHSEELAQVVSAIEGLREEYDLGLYAGNRQGYLDRLTRLTERQKALEALPSRPAGYELVPSGKTYRQAWEASDLHARRKLLTDAEVIAYAGKPKDETDKFELLAGVKVVRPFGRGMTALQAPIALHIFYGHDIEQRLTGNKAQLSSWEIQAKDHKSSIPRPKKPIVKKPDDGTIFTV